MPSVDNMVLETPPELWTAESYTQAMIQSCKHAFEAGITIRVPPIYAKTFVSEKEYLQAKSTNVKFCFSEHHTPNTIEGRVLQNAKFQGSKCFTCCAVLAKIARQKAREGGGKASNSSTTTAAPSSEGCSTIDDIPMGTAGPLLPEAISDAHVEVLLQKVQSVHAWLLTQPEDVNIEITKGPPPTRVADDGVQTSRKAAKVPYTAETFIAYQLDQYQRALAQRKRIRVPIPPVEEFISVSEHRLAVACEFTFCTGCEHKGKRVQPARVNPMANVRTVCSECVRNEKIKHCAQRRQATVEKKTRLTFELWKERFYDPSTLGGYSLSGPKYRAPIPEMFDTTIDYERAYELHLKRKCELSTMHDATRNERNALLVADLKSARVDTTIESLPKKVQKCVGLFCSFKNHVCEREEDIVFCPHSDLGLIDFSGYIGRKRRSACREHYEEYRAEQAERRIKRRENDPTYSVQRKLELQSNAEYRHRFISDECIDRIVAAPSCSYCNRPNASGNVMGADCIFPADNEERDDNVVPCCKECNMAKGGLTAFEFVEHCRKVHTFQSQGVRATTYIPMKMYARRPFTGKMPSPTTQSGTLKNVTLYVFGGRHFLSEETCFTTAMPYRSYARRIEELRVQQGRDDTFHLSEEAFDSLRSKGCAYCGLQLLQHIGLDRPNNEDFYDTAVACCSTCNFVKKFADASAFLNMCAYVSTSSASTLFTPRATAQSSIILIVGLPATGKTTAVRRLFNPRSMPLKRCGLIDFHEAGDTIIVGKYTGTAFDGTDRISLAAYEHLEVFLRERVNTGQRIVIEGDRFTNKLVIRCVYALFAKESVCILHKTISESERAQNIAQRSKRYDVQKLPSEVFLRSRETKIQNISSEWEMHDFDEWEAAHFPVVDTKFSALLSYLRTHDPLVYKTRGGVGGNPRLILGLTWMHPTVGVSADTTRHAELVRLCIDAAKRVHPTFNFTTIYINLNFVGTLHADTMNAGPSMMLTLGEHSGGDLWVCESPTASTRLDPRKGIIFDGNLPHCTFPFTGERFSVVFFTQKQTSLTELEVIRSMGFPIPSANASSSSRKGKLPTVSDAKKMLPSELRCRIPIHIDEVLDGATSSLLQDEGEQLAHESFTAAASAFQGGGEKPTKCTKNEDLGDDTAPTDRVDPAFADALVAFIAFKRAHPEAVASTTDGIMETCDGRRLSVSSWFRHEARAHFMMLDTHEQNLLKSFGFRYCSKTRVDSVVYGRIINSICDYLASSRRALPPKSSRTPIFLTYTDDDNATRRIDMCNWIRYVASKKDDQDWSYKQLQLSPHHMHLLDTWTSTHQSQDELFMHRINEIHKVLKAEGLKVPRLLNSWAPGLACPYAKRGNTFGGGRWLLEVHAELKSGKIASRQLSPHVLHAVRELLNV